MSKALLKSIKREWVAFLPSGVLSMLLNQVCLISTVDRPCEKAC